MHFIILREPWEIEGAVSVPKGAIGRSTGKNAKPAGSVTWLIFRRRFGCPTGLTPETEIDLVIEQPATPGRAWLNDVPLGDLVSGSSTTRFSLRGLLQPRNELMLEFDAGATLPYQGMFREVRLEISEE